ncbi:Npun_R2821/Npun_R2822 family protein [Leptolyngbya sp. FACHB-261]|uniref:Npun_R2821/Npun_R2822 family protein n=1 Tax=Leptolyngbya sp. FACHB-261 TaxID=2692806 RepID=UPI001685746B|nr:Npun_R2821/Npun_R2822 family protein [Leptolyngbya sp. FACHB-261]MBD2099525.1 sugar transferase [Leptolyngbya sp. FACHB-261]
MTDGIYILANDVVHDQLIALLNSIEANAGKEIPICIVPYDNRLDKVRAELRQRPQVSLFEDQDSIAYWENFSAQAWRAHKRAQKAWQAEAEPVVYRLAMHRKLCCLDGPFERFIYFDADTLLMGPLDSVYQKLDQYDWVTNDFQYKSDRKYIFDAPEEQLLKVFSAEQLESQLFCAGWFASKRKVFSSEQLSSLLESLNAGEAEVMALRGPDQSLLNYMVLRSAISYYNFAYNNPQAATGSHWSSKFDVIDQVLHDKGRRVTYIHYMSIPTSDFNQLCAGQDVKIPYRDLFLHYRYLKSPEERPQKLVRANWQPSLKHFSQLISAIPSKVGRRLNQLNAKSSN